MAEDYAQKSEAMKQELEAKIKDIAENFNTNPEEIAEYLKFRSKFYDYSERNAKLIYQQNPGASFVGSFKKFKEMGYSVQKGQHGMKILVPTVKTYLEIGDNKLVPLSKATKEQKAAYKRGDIKGHEKLYYKVGTVFDITQTNIPKEDYPKYLGVGKTSEHHKQLYDLLVKYCNNELDVQVRENQLQSVALRGYYDTATNDITVSGTFNDTARLSILSHEMGHAIIHNGPQLQLQRTAPQVEFEADCYSIMLSTNMGIEIENIRSQHLADSYRAMTKLPDFKPEMLQQSLDRAHKAYKSTVEYINQNFKPELTFKGNLSEQNQNTQNNITDIKSYVNKVAFNTTADQNYLDFSVTTQSGCELDGLYRLETDATGEGGKIVSIDYAENHPDVLRSWEYLENQLNNYSQPLNVIESDSVTQEKLDYFLKSGNVKFEHCVFDDINFNNSQGKILQASDCRFNRCEFNDFDGIATDFKKSVFTDCEFRNSSFYAADLSNSEIYYTRCKNCDFTNSDLMLSRIRHSSFTRSEFSNTELINAKFDSVYFRETKLNSPVKHIDHISVTMGGATNSEVANLERQILNQLNPQSADTQTQAPPSAPTAEPILPNQLPDMGLGGFGMAFS